MGITRGNGGGKQEDGVEGEDENEEGRDQEKGGRNSEQLQVSMKVGDRVTLGCALSIR
jgi:hypothetical protein